MRTAEAGVVSASEAKTLFSCLQTFPALVLAVSGGPDSTALMLLAARWRDSLDTKPKLVAVTVDHGLRKESRSEALAVPRRPSLVGNSFSISCSKSRTFGRWRSFVALARPATTGERARSTRSSPASGRGAADPSPITTEFPARSSGTGSARSTSSLETGPSVR